MSTPVIQIENLSKRFIIRKDKSLKERLVKRPPVQPAQG